MIRIQHAISIAFPLALAGMVNCSSDSNEVIRPPVVNAGAPGAGAPSVTAGAAGATPTAGAPTTGGAPAQAGTGGDPVTTGGSGGGATGGSGGTATAGGAPPAAGAASICTPLNGQVNCSNVLGDMDGYANKDEANGPSEGSDAHQFNCTNSESKPVIYKEKHWQLTGGAIVPGKTYKVDLHYYGVVECKNYVDGTGPALTDNDQVSTTVSHNLLMKGASDNGDHWNTYAFTVTPASSNRFKGIGTPQDNLPADPANNTFVINRCPKAKQASHYTYRIDFSTSVNVPAGSFINYIEYDTNCRMIANCGAADASQSCNGPYNLVDTVSGIIPNTNVLALNQPLANSSNPASRGQWWMVDVTNITEAP